MDTERAESLISALESLTSVKLADVPAALSYLADPDAALLTLLRLAESARDAGELPGLAALGSTRAGAKLAVLLGASTALGDFLIRHPGLAADFTLWDGRDPFTESDPRRELLEAVGADTGAEGRRTRSSSELEDVRTCWVV